MKTKKMIFNSTGEKIVEKESETGSGSGPGDFDGPLPF